MKELLVLISLRRGHCEKKCRFYILRILIPPKTIYMLEATCRIFINKWKILKLFNDFDNKFLWGSNITQIFFI